MSWKRAVSAGLTEVYALRRRRVPARGLRILLYHAVGTPLRFGTPGMSIDAGLFKEQMSLLRRDPQVQTVRLEPDALRETGGCRVAVTFDDGYRDNWTTAAPILAELGIPFTVFVVPAYVQSGDFLYLDKTQLRELADVPGCSIGSHGMNHLRLADVDAARRRAELEASREWMEDLLGRPVLDVSYPHGSANGQVRDAAAAAGYRLGVCSRTGVNGPDRDPLLLCRTEVLGSDDARRFRQKLYGGWDWHRFRRRDPASS